ncbi:MAG: 2-dehydropantoate 2-reductase [Stomatobaculum sp.]|nr:2-dehydropantoate 2-reductase [Stomatobaculum sp.]
MKQGLKICIAGVGAVGGLLAGVIGRKYAESLTLIARGKRAEVLKEKGLVLKSEFYGDSVVHPACIAENGEGIGIQDVVLVCVKNYSLDKIAEQIRPCIGPDTIVAAVMNGVEPGDRLRKLFPEANVCDALIYTTSGAKEDCSVLQTGAYSYIFVGSKLKEERRIEGAKTLDRILREGGFDSRYAEDIEARIWEKFILNCGFNIVTARYLTDSDTIRKNENMKKDLLALMQEAEAVGRAEGVAFEGSPAERGFEHCMTVQKPDATSSMRRDAEAKRPMELDAFLGAVSRKAKEHGIDVPVTERYFKELS